MFMCLYYGLHAIEWNREANIYWVEMLLIMAKLPTLLHRYLGMYSCQPCIVK